MRLSTPLLLTTAKSDTPLSTLTIHPACPSATPSDVIVTRSNAPVPPCAAGDPKKPLITSMDGGETTMMTAGGGATMTPSMSPSGSRAEFTGAAGRNIAGVFGGGFLAGVVAVIV